MSRRSRSLIRTEIKNELLPRNVHRAGCAGTIVGTLGGSRQEVRRAQEGFAAEHFSEVTVWGLDARGKAHDKTTFRVSGSNDGGEIVAVPGDDSVDYVTRTDRGMAEGLRHTAERYLRKGLQAYTTYDYSADVKNDPQRLAQARERYNTCPGEAPEIAEGRELRHVASVCPGVDKNQRISFYRGSKPRR